MKKIIFIIFFLILFAAVGFWIYFNMIISASKEGEEKEFVIKTGQGTREIAANLEEEELISSAKIFYYYVKIQGEVIQAGQYELSPAQNMKEILEVLSLGQTAKKEDLTIPEGWRVTQIDEYLAKEGVIKSGELLQIASADEGYLFPDTYKFIPGTSAQEIRKEMMENFREKTVGQNITRETVILASIVEREAKFDEDRAKIAGVYLTRLEQNMKLQADPTVQYAKGSWAEITQSDYSKVNSPYNTYLNLGLPPGPICNPGLKSIEAVLYPVKDGSLYFFHKTDGRAVFSKTVEEHAANLEKYR